MMVHIEIIACGTNEQGDLLTKLTKPVFAGLGYKDRSTDLAKPGREIDLAGDHRYEKRHAIVECRATRRPVSGTDVNLFAGKVDAEQRTLRIPVYGYFIAPIGGFSGAAREQERLLDRMTLVDGDGLIQELLLHGTVVPPTEAIAAAAQTLVHAGFQVSADPVLVGHAIGWLWAVCGTNASGNRGVCLIHADGKPIARSVADRVMADALTCQSGIADCVVLNASSSKPGDTSAAGPTEMASANALVPEQAEALRIRYLRFIAGELSPIYHAGLPADLTTSQRPVNLEAIYIPSMFADRVSAEGLNRPSRFPGDPAVAAAPVPAYGLGQAITRHRRIAILGLPGAGKTTIIMRLATAYADPARRTLVADGLPDEQLIPVHIRCRDLKGRCSEDIWTIIRGAPARAGLAGETTEFEQDIRQALHEGRLLLLIDGLDEITDQAERASFVESLKNFMARYVACRMVLTSREAGYRSVASVLAGICHPVCVQDLSETGIESFVHRWYEAYFPPSPDVALKAKQVAQKIFDTPQVHSLAGNPLLLTTLLLVHRGQGNLPRERHVLYAEAIKVLLNSWNTEAHESLDVAETTVQLAHIAYHMMLEGRSTIGVAQLSRLIDQARQQLPRKLRYTRLTTEQFIDRIEQRSGLLLRYEATNRGNGQEAYEFMHRAFQEYLAALAVANGWVQTSDKRRDIASLLDGKLSEESWQEVVSLAAALSDDGAIVVSHLTNIIQSGQVSHRTTVIAPANLISCLRDNVQLEEHEADIAMKIALGVAAGSTANLPRIGEVLYGSKFDRHFHDILMETCQISHPHVVAVGAHLAEFAAAHCQTECHNASGYSDWIMLRLRSAQESDRLYGAGAAMHLAYLSTQHKLPDPPDLIEPATFISQAILGPSRQADRLFLFYVWATVWLVQAAPPPLLADLNCLQKRLAHLARTLQHDETARMAAWALLCSGTAGSWNVGFAERKQLLAFARKHSCGKYPVRQSALERDRTHAGFVIRHYLQHPSKRQELLRDIQEYFRHSELPPHPSIEAIRHDIR